MLGADEEERSPRSAGDLRRDRYLVLRVKDQQLVFGGPGVRRGRHRVQRGIADVRGNQPADLAVQGRGEEHPLAASRRLVQDAGDRGHEAQVGHVVGLVDHGDLDAGQRAGTPVQKVDEPARRRHHDVGIAHPGDLPADRHASVDGRDAHADAAAERREHVGDLLGELAGRYKNKAAGCLVAPLVRRGREPGQQRKAEGKRLAGSGLGAAEYVAAGQRVGQCPGLDRERLADVTRGEGRDQPGVQAELGKGCRRRLRRRGGGIQGGLKCGMRLGGSRPGRPGVIGRDRTAARRGAAAALAVAARRRAWPPGTVGHAEDSIGDSEVACSTDVIGNGGRLMQPDCSQSDLRAARPRERRRKSPPRLQGYQPGGYSRAGEHVRRHEGVRRVVILGRGGAGEPALARRLGKAAGGTDRWRSAVRQAARDLGPMLVTAPEPRRLGSGVRRWPGRKGPRDRASRGRRRRRGR
jgi:hypothetical protein